MRVFALPVSAACSECVQVILVPRFAVEQGVDEFGEPKIRAVDNMSWSGCRQTGKKRTRKEIKARSVNGFSRCPEKVKHDHLDEFMLCMRRFMGKSGKVCTCCMLQARVNSGISVLVRR
jgi:hypothetical protein